jgi:hypothetical protein
MFCGVYRKTCDETYPINGSLEIGFPTITMLPVTMLCLQEFMAKNGGTIVSHLPYSPVLAPCDIFLFSKLNLVLRPWWKRNSGKRLNCVLPSFKIKMQVLKDYINILHFITTNNFVA